MGCMKGVKYERHLTQCLEPCVFRTSVDSLLYSIYSIQQRSVELLKNKTCLRWKRTCLQCRRPGFDPWVEKIPGKGTGNPLGYSCLENPMDWGAWWATVHGLSKSQTQPSIWVATAAIYSILCTNSNSIAKNMDVKKKKKNLWKFSWENGA